MSPQIHPAAPGPRLAVLLVAVIAAAALSPAAAAAKTPTPASAARTALSLSAERLSVMRRVMASKWQSRSPVEDLAQIRTKLAGLSPQIADALAGLVDALLKVRGKQSCR